MRYQQQELFSKIGKKGQEILKKSTITIIGLGALGSITSELLTRAGIGKLILIDRDYVELKNLHRQTLYTEEDIGKQKATTAKENLKKINKEVKIEAYFDNFDSTNINLAENLILDCTDNLETRLLINELSISKKIPWIFASAIKDSGYIFNIVPGKTCFRCIFKEIPPQETCSTSGVLNTITTLISSIQTNEAIKILLGKNYEKNLLHFNIWKNELTKIKVKKDPKCPACNKKFSYLNKENQIIKFCGSNNFLFRTNFDYNKLKNDLSKIDRIRDFGNSFQFQNIIVFKNKILIKADNEKEAKSTFSKYIGN